MAANGKDGTQTTLSILPVGYQHASEAVVRYTAAMAELSKRRLAAPCFSADTGINADQPTAHHAVRERKTDKTAGGNQPPVCRLSLNHLGYSAG